MKNRTPTSGPLQNQIGRDTPQLTCVILPLVVTVLRLPRILRVPIRILSQPSTNPRPHDLCRFALVPAAHQRPRRLVGAL